MIHQYILHFVAVATAATALAHTPLNAADSKKSPTQAAHTAIKLPSGFVHLDTFAPDIINDMRYATQRNFTGTRIPGYRANRCILARPVARALTRVQKAVMKTGYSLKVYDCYRPKRGVRAFFQWAQGGFGSPNKSYYPRISRNQIIPLGYVARRSSHSRGTAIDLTLVSLTKAATVTASSKTDGKTANNSCIDPKPEREPASIDMGTSWDCFDKLSHTHNGSISAIAKTNRQRLLRAMQAEGFRNYKREWWHYSMSLQKFKKLHDFPVE